MTITIASLTNALTRMLPKRLEIELREKADPIFAVIEHEEDFFEEAYEVPLETGLIQTLSADFTTAQNAVAPSRYDKFAVTRRLYYGVLNMTRESVLATQHDESKVRKIIDTLQSQTDNIFEALQQEWAFQVYHDHGACRGQLTAAADPLRPSNVATNVVYLQDPRDAMWFRRGMLVSLGTGPGTSGAERAGQVQLVEDGDLDTGKLTLDAATTWAAGIPAAAAQDYVFRARDFGMGLHGLPDWHPTTLLPADNYFGVNRNVAKSVLAGFNYTIPAGLSVREGLINVIMNAHDRGHTFDHIVINTLRWGELDKEVESTRRTTVETQVAKIGYPAIEVQGPLGMVKVLSSPRCNWLDGWCLTKGNVVTRSLGGAPAFIPKFGTKEIVRDRDNADNLEVRAGWMANLFVMKPRKGGRFRFSA